MATQVKVGRNDPCPCGNLKKYKHCCESRIDWNQLFRDRKDFREHLSIRGRNIYFMNRISEALQLDSLGDLQQLKNYKAAFTSKAVREIHEAVMEVWPPNMDIHSNLQRATSEVSGLYIGDYELEYILRGIVRHSVYANKILIVDPFVYPKGMRDEFNPILQPDQYRAQTLKNVNFWMCLMPWVQAGIVELIRTPADFDSKLKWDSMRKQQKKFKETPELASALEASFDEWEERHQNNQRRELLLLSAPDSYIRDTFRTLELGKDGLTADQFVQYVQNLRDQDPNFLEPMGHDEDSGQLHMWSTGSSYDIARLTANLTRAYLVTDLPIRWREIELDRESHSAENRVWAPFAKAVQTTTLKYLNALRLDHALTLRQEQRLESIRGFLKRVWKEACEGDAFDEANSLRLAEELEEQVRLAEIEWKQIDKDLIKMLGTELTAGILAAGPLIASGQGQFVAAAALAAGTFTLGSTVAKRRIFPDKFPAAFFMKLKSDG